MCIRIKFCDNLNRPSIKQWGGRVCWISHTELNNSNLNKYRFNSYIYFLIHFSWVICADNWKSDRILSSYNVFSFSLSLCDTAHVDRLCCVWMRWEWNIYRNRSRKESINSIKNLRKNWIIHSEENENEIKPSKVRDSLSHFSKEVQQQEKKNNN